MSVLLRRRGGSAAILRRNIPLSTITKCLSPSISSLRSSSHVTTVVNHGNPALFGASMISTSSETLGFPPTSSQNGWKMPRANHFHTDVPENRTPNSNHGGGVVDGAGSEDDKNKSSLKEAATRWPRPSMIPWQRDIVNSVYLIGRVGLPIHVESLEDGKSYAVTVIEQKGTPTSPEVWLPVVFEGDLAGIAASHLRENDIIYVSGKLSADSPKITVGSSEASIQVMASLLHYVGRSPEVKNSVPLDKYTPHTPFPGQTHKPYEKEDLWNDVLLHPQNWFDNRKDKKNPKGPDFVHKETREALWINQSTPPSILSRFENPALLDERSSFQTGFPAVSSKPKTRWDDLLMNPQNWWDNRESKKTAKHPDFVHKESREGLWIGSFTPPEVLLALKSPGFFKKSGSTQTDAN